MAGNYQQQGQDWYNERMNRIASMMSMQNSDPNYLLGAAISRYFLKPQLDNYLRGKSGYDNTGAASPEEQQQAVDLLMASPGAQNSDSGAITSANADQLKNADRNIQQPQYQAPQYDMANAITSSPDQMNLMTMGQNQAPQQQAAQDTAVAMAAQQPAKVPTQAEVNQANNNVVDKAVTEASQAGGNMQGMLGNLGLTLGGNAVSSATGIPSFSSARSSRNSSDESGYNGRTLEQMIYEQVAQSKQKYADAQASGDEESMKNAAQQAENARYLAKLYQIPLIGVGPNSTLEDTQKQINRLENDGTTTEDDVRAGFRKGIMAAKQAYSNAQANGDQEGMTRAQTTADTIRRLAAANGIDLPEGGADVTADDLALIMQRDAAKQAQAAEQREADRLRNLTPQELMQRPEVNVSPNDFYQRAYRDAVSRRIPEDVARQIASDKAMQYESSYMRDLSRNMETGGINEDGSLNQAGMALLNRAILANNPEMAQMYMNAFASPRDVWGTNIDFQKAAIQQQYNQALNAQKARSAAALQNQKFQQNWQSDEHKAQLSVAGKAQLAKLEHQLKGQDEMTKAKARIQLAQSMGLDPNSEEMRNYVLTGRIGGGSSGGSSDMSKSEQQLLGTINQMVLDLLSSARNDDAATSGEAIDKFQSELAKLQPKLKDDAYNYYSQAIPYVYNFLREKKAGNENQAAIYWNAIPKDMRKEFLPEYY